MVETAKNAVQERTVQLVQPSAQRVQQEHTAQGALQHVRSVPKEQPPVVLEHQVRVTAKPVGRERMQAMRGRQSV